MVWKTFFLLLGWNFTEENGKGHISGEGHSDTPNINIV